jgi:nucleoside-diphosphate-sugar epimerase
VKVLVLGASGQVGGHVLAALKNHDARGTSSRDADLRDAAALARAVGDADAVICAAALANADYCEDHPSEAYAVNIDGARRAAEASLGRAFALFSTDHVFDGREGPYGEEDRPAPINVYGRTKLEAERVVLTIHPRALVIRTSLVFAPGDRSFFSKLLAATAPLLRPQPGGGRGRAPRARRDGPLERGRRGHAGPARLRTQDRGPLRDRPLAHEARADPRRRAPRAAPPPRRAADRQGPGLPADEIAVERRSA